MPRELITYHIGSRTMYLDAAQVIAFRAELKTVVAFTVEREVVLDCHETICALLDEYAQEFIWIRRGALVRKSAIRSITPINEMLYHDGGLIWLTGKVQPMRVSRNGINILKDLRLLVLNEETGQYENNTRATATFEETKPTMAERTNAGSPRQVFGGAA